MATDGLPVEKACRVLGVSVSGYYSWLDRPPSARAIRHVWLTELIAKIHANSKTAYGARRVHAALTLGHGVKVGHEAVAMLMRHAGPQGLSGRPRYRKVPNMPTAYGFVDRDFERSDPDRLWVRDITEHPTREGKVYCRLARRLLSACGRLVDRLSTGRNPGHLSVGDGDRQPSTHRGRDLFEYLEIWHNRQRRHSALGMMTPVDFEAQRQETMAA